MIWHLYCTEDSHNPQPYLLPIVDVVTQQMILNVDFLFSLNLPHWLCMLIEHVTQLWVIAVPTCGSSGQLATTHSCANNQHLSPKYGLQLCPLAAPAAREDDWLETIG